MGRERSEQGHLREIARLSAFGALDENEIAALTEAAGPERSLDRYESLWRQGDRLPGLFVLIDGWMASTRDDAAVARVHKVHLPGDVLGLPSLAFRAAAEGAIALTKVIVRPLRLHSFGALFEAHPRLAAIMFMVSQQERMDLTDRLISACRHDPRTRIAACAVLLVRRMERAHPNSNSAFRVPLSRTEIADLIGISKSRLEAGLRSLRADNLLGWSNQRLTITDPEGLAALANLPDRTLIEDPHWMPAAGSGQFN